MGGFVFSICVLVGVAGGLAMVAPLARRWAADREVWTLRIRGWHRCHNGMENATPTTTRTTRSCSWAAWPQPSARLTSWRGYTRTSMARPCGCRSRRRPPTLRPGPSAATRCWPAVSTASAGCPGVGWSGSIDTTPPSGGGRPVADHGQWVPGGRPGRSRRRAGRQHRGPELGPQGPDGERTLVLASDDNLGEGQIMRFIAFAVHS